MILEYFQFLTVNRKFDYPCISTNFKKVIKGFAVIIKDIESQTKIYNTHNGSLQVEKLIE